MDVSNEHAAYFSRVEQIPSRDTQDVLRIPKKFLAIK
jgi:hypothetical protein